MNLERIFLLSMLSMLVFLSACRKDDDDNIPTSVDEQLEDALIASSNGVGKFHYVLPSSTDFSSIPQDPKNPLTTEKVALGKLLYHETGLGISPMMNESAGQYSCASCHFASAGFQANRFQGISEGGQGFGINGEGRERNTNYDEAMLDVQPLRTPSSMNNAFQTNLLWNGQFGATGINTGTDAYWTPGTPIAVNELGYEGLETQAIAGLGVHRMDIESLPNIIEDLGYKAMFDNVFGGFPENERYTKETAGLAIAAYERTLFSNQAPFQKYLKGETNAITTQEKNGAILFFGDAGCASCHNGPGLNNMEFHALGMNDLYTCPEEIFKTSPDDPAHRGRGSFTGQSSDDYKFKVPQLYNMKDSPFYGHGASFRSIRDVVEYKNQANPENQNVPASQLAEDFVPLNLTDQQVDDITAFLKFSLYDPYLDRYVPESLPSGNCFPFNDPIARVDLGCN
jgi:cytochrome c peroxidase